MFDVVGDVPQDGNTHNKYLELDVLHLSTQLLSWSTLYYTVYFLLLKLLSSQGLL